MFRVGEIESQLSAWPPEHSEGSAVVCHHNQIGLFSSKSAHARATAQERQLKGWLCSRQIALIESVNPAWTDPSAIGISASLRNQRRASDRMISQRTTADPSLRSG